MSDLPNSKEFKSYKLRLVDNPVSKVHTSTLNIDLNAFHKSLLCAKKENENRSLLDEKNINPSKLLYELFDLKFLRSFNKRLTPILDQYVGYSTKYKTLSVSVLDENKDVKAIALRKAWDKEGYEIKWKSYGSKTFIPFDLTNKPFVFFAVGMAEYILFKLMEVDYILLQSDGMYKHINKDLIQKCTNKNIIILKENDESFNKLIKNLESLFIESNIYVIDFEKLLKKELKKSFDVRDFFNEIKDIGVAEQLIEENLKQQIIRKEK